MVRSQDTLQIKTYTNVPHNSEINLICEILGFHGGDKEEDSLLGYGAV
jgi:hypothetical protein